jgi:hypothetical protein
VRDFDANRSYQDLINKIDYFKNLKIKRDWINASW